MKRNSIFLVMIIAFISCEKPQIRKPVVHHSTVSSFDESVQLTKKVLALEEKIFKKIIKKDTINKYYASPYGFWYFYNHKIEENTKKPSTGDEVVINYEIKDLNNKVILSEQELGSKNQDNKKNRLLKIDGEDFLLGLHHGIKLMKEGEIMTFLLPSNLAFGVTGLQGKISSNEPLIVKVKLIKILTK